MGSVAGEVYVGFRKKQGGGGSTPWGRTRHIARSSGGSKEGSVLPLFLVEHFCQLKGWDYGPNLYDAIMAQAFKQNCVNDAFGKVEKKSVIGGVLALKYILLPASDYLEWFRQTKRKPCLGMVAQHDMTICGYLTTRRVQHVACRMM